MCTPFIPGRPWTGPNTRTGEAKRPVRRRIKVKTRLRKGAAGFSLLELLIVVALIGILASLVVPQFRKTPDKAREAVLKEDLFTMRDVIDQYYADKGRYPASLETLVEEGYLRQIPVDPFTNSADTWQTEAAPMEDGEDAGGGGGIYDVHSGATGVAEDGTSYSEW
jgi:general secretion pathway protein G